MTPLIATSQPAGHHAGVSIKPRYVVAALGVGAIALTVALHRGPLLHPGDVWQAVAMADRKWLFLAAFAQFASLVAFAEQHRYLLKKFGGRMTLSRSIAMTLARTAISVSVPAGSAVSLGFVIRQFRARGVSAGAATAVTVLSGVQALATLLTVYLAWFSTVGLSNGSSNLLTAGLAILLLVGAFAALHWTRSHTNLGTRLRALASRWRWTAALYEVATGAVRSATSLSVADWAAGGAASMANWLLDVACLIFTARAFGLTLGVVQVIGTYLAIQLVRQIPLTPGGVGVVEASLLVALVALGATSGTAAAVVLIYRLLSTWLLVPIGLVAWVGLRPHRGGGSGSAPPDDGVETGGEQEHGAGDDVLVTGRVRSLDQVAHPVGDDGDDEPAEHGVDHPAVPAEKGGAADHRGPHRQQQRVAGSGVRLHRLQ